MNYPIYHDGKQCGILDVSNIDEDTCFDLSGDADGLYRVWVEGEQGELPLGIMENGRLHRRFSLQMTRPIGRPICARIESLACVNTQWRAVTVGEFTGWPLPDDACCRQTGRQYELALPYDDKDNFPLLSLFCFAKICTMAGRDYAVFCFDDKWNPVMRKN